MNMEQSEKDLELAQEKEEQAVKEALLRLKSSKDFPIYANEVRGLTKSLILRIINTKPLSDQDVNKILFMQGQLDILAGVYGMTLDQIINETVDEQFAESSK